VRDYFASLLNPVLEPARTYQLEYRPGLMGQYGRSQDLLALCLLANIGNKWKKAPVRETFLPLGNVRVRIRLPEGRAVKSVSLLRAGRPLQWTARQGWVELTVPRVWIYEVVKVQLS